MHLHDVFFACAPGVEALLVAELKALGLKPKPVSGGADLRLNDLNLVRAVYSVGLATHVRVRVGRGSVKNLKKWASRIDWNAYATGPATVRAAGVGEAFCDELQSLLPPNSGDDPWTVLARRDENEVELSVDVSGDPLYRRGYRRGTAKAPLRSDLARALLLLSGWKPTDALTDPFCGSGTILAEALLLAGQVPPAFLRTLVCLKWPGFDRAEITDLVQDLRSPTAVSTATVFASDRDEGAAQIARDNLARITDALGCPAVNVECAAFKSATHWSSGGWLISNPPHGGRVGKTNTLRNLYQSIGHQAGKHDMQLALLVADRKMAYATGTPLKSALFTRHGGRKIWIMTPEGSS